MRCSFFAFLSSRMAVISQAHFMSGDLTFIPLDDPTNTKPWYDADIEVLCRAAADARKSILAGKKVAFLCKAGLNRSPTLAKMASHGIKSAGVAMPVDEALCELALCDLEDPFAAARTGGRAQAAQAVASGRLE